MFTCSCCRPRIFKPVSMLEFVLLLPEYFTRKNTQATAKQATTIGTTVLKKSKYKSFGEVEKVDKKKRFYNLSI